LRALTLCSTLFIHLSYHADNITSI
jgi:hypothetical protein